MVQGIKFNVSRKRRLRFELWDFFGQDRLGCVVESFA